MSAAILEKEIMDIINKDCFPDEKCRLLIRLVEHFHKGEGINMEKYLDVARQTGMVNVEGNTWVNGQARFTLTNNGFKRLD